MSVGPRWVWSAAALVLIGGVGIAVAPGFLTIEFAHGALRGSLVDACDQGAPLLLVALGMALVVATGGIDLSVGAVMAIAGAVGATALSAGHATPVAITAALGAGLACGAFNGALVAFLRIPPIVATLVLMVAGRGVAQLLTDGQILTVAPESPFAFLGAGTLVALPMPAILALAIVALLIGVVRGTALGLFLECTGANREASRLAGVPVRGVTLAAYVVSGLTSAIAGLLVTSDILAADANNLGLRIELDAVLAVVVGGTALSGGRFSLVGAALGAVAVKAADILMQTAGVDPAVALVVKAVAIVAVAALSSLVSGRASRDHGESKPAPHAFAPRPWRAIAAAVMCAVLLGIGAIRFDGFLSWYYLSTSLLGDSVPLAFAAIGMTAVILTGGIDLSVGAVAAFASVAFVRLANGFDAAGAVAIVVAGGAAFGLTQGLVTRGLGLPSFLVTLAGLFAARGLALILEPGARVTLENATALGIGQARLVGVPTPAIALVVSALALALFVSRTRVGRTMLAIGADREAARALGLPVFGAECSAYVASGSCAALAGISVAIATGAGDATGLPGLELDAIAAAAIGGASLLGGRGSVWGTLVGVLTLATVQSLLSFDGTLSSWWARIATGALLLLFAAARRE